MTKIRKSREQKIKADYRHFDYHYEAASSPKPSPNLNRIVHTDTHIASYPYLRSDLIKTMIITSAILGFQILTFILLKSKIISIPAVAY